MVLEKDELGHAALRTTRGSFLVMSGQIAVSTVSLPPKKHRDADVSGIAKTASTLSLRHVP